MKHIEDLDDLLDAYLDGNLVDLDRKEFEYVLANDPALRQRLELFKVERLVGDELILRDIRRTVKVVLTQAKPMPTWTTTINILRLSAAAAVLLMLISAVYYWDKRAESHSSPMIATTDKEAKQANPSEKESQTIPQTTAPLAPSGKGEVKKPQASPVPPPPIASTPVAPALDPTAVNPETVDAVALVSTATTLETELQNKVEALDRQLNASFRGNGQETQVDAGEESFRKALSFCQEKKYGEAMPLLEKFLKENTDHYLNSEATALVQMLRRLKQ